MQVNCLNRDELRNKLEKKARLLRWDIVKMTGCAGSGHPGGSLSAADIVAVLYWHHLRHKPQEPDWPDRDRFVLSKGHSCPALYAALAETGYFERETLWTLRQVGSILQGHPDMRKTPGVEISSGALGHGLSVANGMSLAARLDKKDYQVYVMIGDGESQEGEIWEAAMFAAHYKLDNLVAIVDHNGLQIDGPVSEVMEVEPLDRKWSSFGWHTFSIDGHNIDEIFDALEEADKVKGKPCVIIARTIKGKGVSFMEGAVDFHGKAPCEEETEAALKEIEASGEVG